MPKITITLNVPYDEKTDKYLTYRVVALLREIADISIKAIEADAFCGNVERNSATLIPPNIENKLQNGSFMWVRND